eukprot:CAMPEP_0204346890 /NCGR_PEP_ID=MMETSP0469-20131031/27518_1 /ASSEMBLY_ACC=CAM_ASM_000384 /TAXON_ID=2969 /ORGANISM="Oxyrrhis marina" /LENGTH=440 /DNA_ID=CAMNT_0051332583 /DNA_START=62 /DNA_END=1384 /DNA_ORIENTATION=+
MERLKGFLPGKARRDKLPATSSPLLGGGHEGRESRDSGGLGGGPPGGNRSSGSGGRAGPTSVNDFISQTKSRQQQGLKPSGPELIAYARYLGIDVVNDNDLLWIAEEALAAPLPCEWTEHFDSSDRVFYFNATTHVSSWTHPMETMYRETYQSIATFRNATMSAAEKQDKIMTHQREVQQLEEGVQREVTAWTEHEDEGGHKFFFNRQLGKSSWTDPRPARCHTLYLKMKMVRILCTHAGVSLEELENAGHQEMTFDMPAMPQTESRDPGAKRPKMKKSEKVDNPTSGGDGGFGGERDSPGFGAPDDLQDADLPDEFNADGELVEKKKKKKKKKHKQQGGLLPSASEPGLSLNSPAPPMADESRMGMGTGLNAGNAAVSASAGQLGDVNRARVKPGIRLQPLSVERDGPPGPGGMGGGGGLPPMSMANSRSAPALKPVFG